MNRRRFVRNSAIAGVASLGVGGNPWLLAAPMDPLTAWSIRYGASVESTSGGIKALRVSLKSEQMLIALRELTDVVSQPIRCEGRRLVSVRSGSGFTVDLGVA